MKTAVLILAAGRTRRGWTEEAPKQFALIAGEPLILRTLRQLKERGYDEEVVVVTHNEAIKAAVPRVFAPEFNRYWHETFSSTRILWSDRTIVLNGDTIFSDAVLSQILAPQSGIMFYSEEKGNRPHISAVSFSSADSEEVAAAARTATREAARQKGMRIHLIWGLYHVLYGLPLRKPNRPIKGTFIFQPEQDYTIDIDSVGQYKQFLAEHAWARDKEV